MKCYGEEKSLQAIAEASNAETLDTENVGDTADNLYFGVKQPTRVSFFLSRGNEVLGDYTMYMLYDTQENTPRRPQLRAEAGSRRRQLTWAPERVRNLNSSQKKY